MLSCTPPLTLPLCYREKVQQLETDMASVRRKVEEVCEIDQFEQTLADTNDDIASAQEWVVPSCRYPRSSYLTACYWSSGTIVPYSSLYLPTSLNIYTFPSLFCGSSLTLCSRFPSFYPLFYNFFSPLICFLLSFPFPPSFLLFLLLSALSLAFSASFYPFPLHFLSRLPSAVRPLHSFLCFLSSLPSASPSIPSV